MALLVPSMLAALIFSDIAVGVSLAGGVPVMVPVEVS